MVRTLTVLATLSAIGMAVGLYWMKHDTRQLDARVQAAERAIEKAETDIQVLRAEFGFLTRPERLDLLARRHLGLEPATARQVLPEGPGPAHGAATRDRK